MKVLTKPDETAFVAIVRTFDAPRTYMRNQCYQREYLLRPPSS